MLTYKNVSYSTKTFHGVTFKPGEVHQVPNYINDPLMIVVVPPEVQDKKRAQKESPKVSQKDSTPQDNDAKPSKEGNEDGENSSK